MKLDNKIKFTDKEISNVKHVDIIFTYTNKEGQIKTRPWINIPFENLKHTRLKGLKFKVFRNGGIYFILQYWFAGKSKKIESSFDSNSMGLPTFSNSLNDPP